MAKAFFLYLDTNNVAKLVKRKIKDGFVELDNKMFLVDETSPILVQGRLGGFTPFYIVKWTNIKSSNELGPMKLQNVGPEFKKENFDMTPEMLRKLTGLKILGNMIKPIKKGAGGFLTLILGFVAGAIILWALIYFKLIPIAF